MQVYTNTDRQPTPGHVLVGALQNGKWNFMFCRHFINFVKSTFSCQLSWIFLDSLAYLCNVLECWKCTSLSHKPWSLHVLETLVIALELAYSFQVSSNLTHLLLLFNYDAINIGQAIINCNIMPKHTRRQTFNQSQFK